MAECGDVGSDCLSDFISGDRAGFAKCSLDGRPRIARKRQVFGLREGGDEQVESSDALLALTLCGLAIFDHQRVWPKSSTETLDDFERTGVLVFVSHPLEPPIDRRQRRGEERVCDAVLGRIDRQYELIVLSPAHSAF